MQSFKISNRIFLANSDTQFSVFFVVKVRLVKNFMNITISVAKIVAKAGDWPATNYG